MRSRLTPLLIAALFTALISACGGDSTPSQPQNNADPFIVAVNSPLQYFAQRLIGDEVEVRMPAPAGSDPAQWQPAVEDILQLQQAELILLNGAGYSHWLNKVSLSDHQLIDTSKAASETLIRIETQVTHSHGPKGEHAHGDYAFTTWMDMDLARVQAQAVAAALRMRWPERRDDIDRNLTALIGDLQQLAEAYTETASHLQSRQLVYSHPVYQYFERRYGLPGTSLHWEPNIMPEEAQWDELRKVATESTLFVWEAEPSEDIALRMRDMAVEFVIVDPAANTAEDDWLIVQRANIAMLSAP
jgi:zinc transport system substrate-binding protein